MIQTPSNQVWGTVLPVETLDTQLTTH